MCATENASALSLWYGLIRLFFTVGIKTTIPRLPKSPGFAASRLTLAVTAIAGREAASLGPLGSLVIEV
jgi:hypothetical protein